MHAPVDFSRARWANSWRTGGCYWEMSGSRAGDGKTELETRKAEISRLGHRIVACSAEQGAQRTDATAEGTNNTSAEDNRGRCDREELHSGEPEDWIVASHTVSLWARTKLVQFHHRYLGWTDTADYSDDKLRQATVSTIVYHSEIG